MTRKFTIFRIGTEIFGLGIERVVEILKVQKSYTIPGLPGFLMGVMSVRGMVMPVIDLRRRFGVEPSGKKERVIIALVGGERVGFIVDEVKEILALDQADIRKPPEIFRGFKTEYIMGIGKTDDRIIILLNIDNLLTSEEKIQLKESLTMLEEKGGGDQTATR